MAEDLSTLNYTFDLYYQKAKEHHQNGNIDLAKRNYLMAAQQLMKIAKLNQGSLQKAQFERAQRLITLAESLPQQMARKDVVRQPKNTRQSGASDNKEAEQEDGKQWTGATVPDVHFSDIAGLDDVKHVITMRMINPIKYPEKYAAYGKRTGGGVLLYGPPGTGKTMIARAIACEVGAVFYVVKGSDIMSKWVGESEQNIRSLFDAARKDPLAIIFIDEMDSLFGSRGMDIHNDKRVNEFLQQIDGFIGACPTILLLGATNRPWDVDSAAVRSGRFSEKIYVPLPDAPARLFLFKKNLNAPLEEGIDWDLLVSRTQGYSGADIAEICDLAKEEPLMNYIENDVIQPIKQSDIERAIDKVRPMVSKQEILRFERYAGIEHVPEAPKAPKSKPTAPADLENKEEKPEKPMAPQPPENKPQDESPAKADPAPAPKPAVVVTPEATEVYLLPNQPVRLTFKVDPPFEHLSVKLDGNVYACEKLHFDIWQTQPINNARAGEFNVDVCAASIIGTYKVTFIKGIVEDDMGI